MLLKLVEEKILDTLVHRAEMANERAIFFTTEREKMADEWREALAAVGEHDAWLADFGELKVEISRELRLGVGRRSDGGRLGGREHDAAARRRKVAIA